MILKFSENNCRISQLITIQNKVILLLTIDRFFTNYIFITYIYFKIMKSNALVEYSELFYLFVMLLITII